MSRGIDIYKLRSLAESEDRLREFGPAVVNAIDLLMQDAEEMNERLNRLEKKSGGQSLRLKIMGG